VGTGSSASPGRSVDDEAGTPDAPSREVLLDHASGQPLHPAARDVLAQAMSRGYADPRGLHRASREARLLLDNAHAVVAEALGVRPDEVTFTPSGTHAVHLGLLGLHLARGRVGRTIVHSAVEHSAVLQAARWTGSPVIEVPVDRTGRVEPDAPAELVSRSPEPVAVVALQTANQEVGTLQPVAEVAASLGDVPLFTDACASMGRLPLPGGWAAAAGSAHKWGGPAGVGVLLVRHGARWRQPFPSDDRVDPRSTGFENVPAALAAAAALRAVVEESARESVRQAALVDRLRAGVATLPDVDVVGNPDDRLPHLLTFSCLYVDGEALVTALDRHGLAVASGSACTASTLEPSHVLAAMGALTHGNVRVSLGRDTAQDDVDRLLADLPGIVEQLRDGSGVPR
jgi:cysteine desulfurase